MHTTDMFIELDQTALLSMPCLLYMDTFCYFFDTHSLKVNEAETVIMFCHTHHKSFAVSSADITALLIILENVHVKWNCCAHLKMKTCGLCIKKYAQDYFAIVISVLLTNFK